MEPSLLFIFTEEKTKVVLKDWAETDTQTYKRSVGVTLLPTPSFQSPFVLSYQSEDRKASSTESYSLGSCFQNMATLQKLGTHH